MKLPFRGRATGTDDFDDHGFDDYEDEDFESSSRPVVRRAEEQTRPQVTGEVPPPVPAGPPQRRATGAGGADGVDGPGRPSLRSGEVPAAEFATVSERSSAAVSAELRSAWIYLGVLGMLFVLVVGFGYGFSGRLGSDPGPQQPAEMLASAEPVRLEFRIDGDIATLRGGVPDQAARDQLVAVAREVYGVENVVDSLVVDPDTTLDQGSIRVIGSAKVGDERPETLRDRVSEGFGLANRGFEVGFVETVLTPVLAVASIDGSRVTLSGTMPDEQSVIDLTGIAGEVWGAANVDAGALVVGDTTWSSGRIQMAGTPVVTDAGVTRFITLVGERIGTLVAVETNGLSAGDDPALVATQQATVDTLVLNSPIQFTPQSAEISPDSEALLVEVAAALAQVPVTPVEIVGHTDSAGDEQENLVLSEGRAKAVMARLIELGVPAELLTARGEGANVPVADNDTDEGRAANRRIQFILVGPGG